MRGVPGAAARAARSGSPTGAYLRPIAFMGDGAMGLGAVNPTRVAVTAWDWGAYLGDKGMRGRHPREGLELHPHAREREHGAREDHRPVRELASSPSARRCWRGYDEAILLDIAGFVAEASGENIFMREQEGRRADAAAVLADPRAASPATRCSSCCGTRAARWRRSPSPATRSTSANEVFFTGTAAEITPVREVDNRRIGDRQAGTGGASRSRSTYFRVVRGQEPRYAEWLTYV